MFFTLIKDINDNDNKQKSSYFKTNEYNWYKFNR
jgi:hypothetical protein